MDKLLKEAFVRLCDEDLEWLKNQPDSLERQHIEAIVADSPARYYDDNTRIAELEAKLKSQEWKEDNPHESILNTVNRGMFLVEAEYSRHHVTFTRVETAWFSQSEGWEIKGDVQRWMLLPSPYSTKEQTS